MPLRNSQELHPYASYDVSMEKRRIASDQAYDEGNHEGNVDATPDLTFTKALPHDSSGRVEKRAWSAFVRAIDSRSPEAWAAVPLGSKTGAKLVSPCSGFSYELDGPAPSSVGVPPAPTVSSAESAADMVELYEMYMARDIPFTQFHKNRRLTRAARRLTRLSAYAGPRSRGAVTTNNLFRGPTRGDLEGPYLSQLLILPLNRINATQEQLYHYPPPDSDFMKTWTTASACQNGAVLEPPPKMSKVPRYVRTPRDLAWYVHEDLPHEAYVNAVLVLKRLGAPLSPFNPYANGSVKNQTNFVSLGLNDLIDVISRVCKCAMNATWYHKWMVHQRLRPESAAMIIDRILQTDDNPHHVHKDILDSKTMNSVYKRNRNLLLPQAYPEGSPCHPSYPSGHATIASACVTVMKAFFDERWSFPRAFVPDEEGTDLVEVVTPRKLTLGGELDKLASNLSMGRSFAGVHYRSDSTAGWELGERVAVRMLKDLIQRYPERNVKFVFHLRDGTQVTIKHA